MYITYIRTWIELPASVTQVQTAVLNYLNINHHIWLYILDLNEHFHVKNMTIMIDGIHVISPK